MKIIGVIPSRYESSRFPGKPLAEICGKPMIYWVYQQVIQVKDFDAVYVATDDGRIEEVCKQYGMNCIMTANTHQTGTDRLGEVAQKIEADFYVNIQGDEPMIEPETIQKVVDYKMEHPETRVINTITPIREELEITSNTCVKVVTNSEDDGIYLSRSPIPYPKKGQEITYYKHLGLYGLTREALLFFAGAKRTKLEQIEDIEMLRFIENHINIKFVTVDSSTIAVDRKEDIARVEAAMSKKQN
jgi:3-deoxy-manno-octulosonate cytidylyltransferase (CMP-KDO synthetase)